MLKLEDCLKARVTDARCGLPLDTWVAVLEIFPPTYREDYLPVVCVVVLSHPLIGHMTLLPFKSIEVEV